MVKDVLRIQIQGHAMYKLWRKSQFLSQKAGQWKKKFSTIELRLNVLRDQQHDVQEDMTTDLFNPVLITQEKANTLGPEEMGKSE